MALLKSLIQRLLDSRTTPSEAGHAAMPSTAKTIFLSKDETVGSWGILNAGIAPDDGYLFVNVRDHLRMEIFRSGLTLKKVKNLPTQLGNQISSLLPIFEYTKSRGTLDPMFGGASC